MSLALAALLGAPLLVPVGTPVATAAGAGGCSDADVTVVVDPGPLGGAPQVGCANVRSGGEVATRLTSDAGFPLTLVAGQPFVCRVGGRPAAAREDCSGIPPGDAYWGLFWADADASRWTYSSLGATSLEVPQGGAVGWRFEDGGDLEEPRLGPVAGGAGETSAQGAPRAEPGDEAGSTLPLTLVAAGCVAVLAGVAGILARRRGR